jgi:hypothetical protein
LGVFGSFFVGLAPDLAGLKAVKGVIPAIGFSSRSLYLLCAWGGIFSAKAREMGIRHQPGILGGDMRVYRD